MALFQHGHRSIDYRVEPAPFPQDLVLLQGSKFNTDFWRPVLEALHRAGPGSGRILVCDWSPDGLSDDEAATELQGLIKGLGFSPTDVVACGDAVAAVNTWEKSGEGVSRKLVFPGLTPKSDELIRQISAFCGI
jgi:hypothetical protein